MSKHPSSANPAIRPESGAADNHRTTGNSASDAADQRRASGTASSTSPGGRSSQTAKPFKPYAPETPGEAGIPATEIESLTLKYLLSARSASGRNIAAQLKLPFSVVNPIFQSMKSQLLVAYKGAAPMSDYEFELTSQGVEKAHACNQRCTYFGAAPVSLEDYVHSVKQQSVKKAKPRLADLQLAFKDLVLPAEIISQLGQAVNFGQALFLFGKPGNGKTTIAERIIRGVKQYIWIPRTITVTGEIIRVYDPSNHKEAPIEEDMLSDKRQHDQRWVRIERPTVVVGGELSHQHLEITTNPNTGINESPIQLKSNGGALVVDDFGRQRVSTTELLNRWIVPLEKGYDFLTLPSGRQLQIPFDQVLIFATNLEPKELVDEAFLRRIPFKVEVFDPTEDEFRKLFHLLAGNTGLHCDDAVIDYLLEEHYRQKQRPMRYCHVRDLLLQICNFCDFHERPLEISRETIDVAVKNYFAAIDH